MKSLRILTLSLLLAVAASAEPWLTSWDAAAKQSKATGRPILMDFTGSDWCIWCKRLKSEVFDTDEFKKWASQKVVLLEVDFPQSVPQSASVKAQNAKLQQKYQVEGYPTIIFADAKGTVLAKYGYDKGGPAVWTKKADEMLNKK